MKGGATMKTVTCSDLFEDEIAEVLREYPQHDTLFFSGRYMFSPACMICDDGIYTSGAGYYTEYLDGVRTGNHISTGILIQALAHQTFTIKVREAAK
jgi:hypothetical protein